MPSPRPKKQRVDALVFVGDAMEENVDRLCQLAGELGLNGVPIFLFHEGGDADRRQRLPADGEPLARRVPSL